MGIPACLAGHMTRQQYISRCTVDVSQLVWRQQTGNIKCMMGYVTWYTPLDGDPPDGEPPLMETPWMENPPGWRTPPGGEPPWKENPPGWRTPPTPPPWMENPPMENPLGWRTPPGGEPPGMETPQRRTPPIQKMYILTAITHFLHVSLNIYID